EALRAIESSRDVKQDLERRNAAVIDRITAKDQVADEVIAGRLTLVEAAARFRDLNAVPPDHPDPYRTTYPGGSDREKLCRQVISWVASATGRAQAEARALVACLEAELEDLLGRHGTIELPK